MGNEIKFISINPSQMYQKIRENKVNVLFIYSSISYVITLQSHLKTRLTNEKAKGVMDNVEDIR